MQKPISRLSKASFNPFTYASKHVTTFEPLGGEPFAKVLGEERWHLTSTAITAFMNWPFQEGRAPFTLMLRTLLGILAVCFAAGR